MTTNLTGNPGGITIAASGVTLDLMGFELVGGTGDGIVVSGSRTNIAIRNGTVRNWSGNGVHTANATNSQLERLRVSSNGLRGIQAGPGSTVSGCTAWANTNDGIWVTANCHVVANTCYKNGRGAGGVAGILVTGWGNRIDGNNVTANGWGIRVELAGNLIIRDSARLNMTNYFFTGAQTFGPANHLVGTDGVITNAHPWADFIF